MPLVSVNILTKNRAALLRGALESVEEQSFKDFEVVVVNDGSTDETEEVIGEFKHLNIKTLKHAGSIGITRSRQEALLTSTGEFIAVLDDDDEWADPNKLQKQVEYFKAHPKTVLVGGGRNRIEDLKIEKLKNEGPAARGKQIAKRPQSDRIIRKTMLLRNNFFTSTVMLRKSAALEAGGFVADGIDLAEDYDLWLRLGLKGEMYNFQEPFDLYRVPSYNKSKRKQFLSKQLRLIKQYHKDYPAYWIASFILKIRLLLNF